MIERMDFDIGTLIYIIATLVAVIAGAFTKKKKPGGEQGAPSGSEEKSSGGIFGKLEEQLGGFVEETKQFAGEIRQEFTSSEEALEDIRDSDHQFAEDVYEDRKEGANEIPSAFAEYEGVFDPDMLMNQELIEAEAERTTGLQVIDLDDESYADYYEIISGFDLGTAVVYSAIINRPEY